MNIQAKCKKLAKLIDKQAIWRNRQFGHDVGQNYKSFIYLYGCLFAHQNLNLFYNFLVLELCQKYRKGLFKIHQKLELFPSFFKIVQNN